MAITGLTGSKNISVPEYTLPNGSTLKLEISMSLGATTTVTTTNVELINLGKLKYPGEISSGGQKMKLANIEFKFNDPSQELDTELLFDEKNPTFLKLLIDGTKKFDGFLNHKSLFHRFLS